jgi:hypothetical protein
MNIGSLRSLIVMALIVMFLLTSVSSVTWTMPRYFFSIEMPRSPMLISTPVVFCLSW